MCNSKKVEPKVKMVLKEAILREAGFEDYGVDSGKFSVNPQTVLSYYNTNCFLFGVEFIGDGSREWFIEELSKQEDIGDHSAEWRALSVATFSDGYIAISDYVMAESVIPAIKESNGLIKVYVDSKGVKITSDLYGYSTANGKDIIANTNTYKGTYNGTVYKKGDGVVINCDVDFYNFNIGGYCFNFTDLVDGLPKVEVVTFKEFIGDLTTALNSGCIEWL